MNEPSVRFLFLVSIAVGIEHNLEIQNVDNLVQICSMQHCHTIWLWSYLHDSSVLQFLKGRIQHASDKGSVNSDDDDDGKDFLRAKVLTKWQLCWWWSWLQSGDNDWDCIITTTPWLQRPSWWLWLWCKWWWWWWPWKWWWQRWFAKWWRHLACTQGRMTHSRAQLWSVALPCRSM